MGLTIAMSIYLPVPHCQSRRASSTLDNSKRFRFCHKSYKIRDVHFSLSEKIDIIGTKVLQIQFEPSQHVGSLLYYTYALPPSYNPLHLSK
jgi:hypothetical protein